MPVVYNTTFIMTPSREEEFLNFIRSRYLAILQAETQASDYRLLKIATPQGEEATLSYALQYRFTSQAELDEALPRVSPILNHLVSKYFAQEVIGFSTTMTEIGL